MRPESPRETKIPETSQETHEATHKESSPDKLFTFDIENKLGNGEPLIEDIQPG